MATWRLITAFVLLAANTGGAMMYVLLSPRLFTDPTPLLLWGLGSILAATKIAARMVRSDPEGVVIPGPWQLQVMTPFKLGSVACFAAACLLVALHPA